MKANEMYRIFLKEENGTKYIKIRHINKDKKCWENYDPKWSKEKKEEILKAIIEIHEITKNEYIDIWHN